METNIGIYGEAYSKYLIFFFFHNKSHSIKEAKNSQLKKSNIPIYLITSQTSLSLKCHQACIIPVSPVYNVSC